MADGKVRALVATASLDLGIDWGDIDLVIQMGAPKGSRLLQRIGRANHRLDEPSKGMIVPGNRFEYLEARPPSTRSTTANSIPKVSARNSTCLPSTSAGIVPDRSTRPSYCRNPLRRPYAGLKDETFREILNFVATGGYALKAYDRFRRIVEERPPPAAGAWQSRRSPSSIG